MTVDSNVRVEPKSTLQAMDVHDSWSRGFRSAENNRFYELAFNYLAREFGEPGEDRVVDAGCGSATKSLQLAQRGYRVQALDFSEAMPSQSARRVLCWGVLMHVPAVEKAVAELARIVAPGGKLVVSEGNKRSLQAWTLSTLKKLLGRERAEIVNAPAGKEFWEETRAGRLMTRQADIPWLIREFERHGLRLIERRAGQFSEIYISLPWKPLRSFVHAFNNLWFRALPSFAGGAYGNLLVFERPA
jgi:SAM-dependent methyltransferase